MTFSIAELFLLAWAIIATLGYGYVSKEFFRHRAITGKLLSHIAKGKIKVVETDDSFELKEV